MIMFTFGNARITVDSVITLTKMNQEIKNLAFNAAGTIQTIVNKIGTGLVTEYHARQLENNFPDFGRTMKEYEEGILLFKAEQENVWNKVQPTDSVLRLYHSQHSAKYTWPDRVNIQEIYLPSDSVAKLVQKSLLGYTVDSLVAKKPKTKSKSKKTEYDTIKIAIAPISYDSAAVRYNTRGTSLPNRGVLGLQPITTNNLTQRAWSMTENDSTTYVPHDGGFSFTKVIQKDPAREKTFEEAQSEVSGAFQEYETKRLGDEWFESLKKKYPVTYHKESLTKTFAKPQQVGAAQEKQ